MPIPGAQYHERGHSRRWRRRCGWKRHVSIPPRFVAELERLAKQR